jgi:hypothetical protein
MAVTVALGHPDQALDLALGEVLAIAAHVPVAAPAQWSATSKKLYLNLAALSLRR